MYGSTVSKDLNLPATYGHRKEEPEAFAAAQQQHRASNPTMGGGLLRYRSAPSTLLGEVCEDLVLPQPTAAATAAADSSMFARFVGADLREHNSKPGSGGQHFAAAAMEEAAAHHQHHQQQHMLYHQQQQQQQQQQMAAAHGGIDGMYRPVCSSAMEGGEQMKSGGTANLIRQSSSPAGLFNHLNVENGYGSMLRGGMSGNFRNGNSPGGGGDPAGGGNRLKGQLSFSSRQGSLMSQISEMSEDIGGSSPEGAGSGSRFIPGFPMTSNWEESALLSDGLSGSGMKRHRDESAQNGLAHQFSLPKTSSEMAAIEKFLQFQDAVPCKIRAKRGCATHPRSIAERVRRTRISERIRKLQELVPNMDKQTNTSDMLDLAVDYIKDLQKQVKVITDNRAGCTCSASKQKY